MNMSSRSCAVVMSRRDECSLPGQHERRRSILPRLPRFSPMSPVPRPGAGAVLRRAVMTIPFGRRHFRRNVAGVLRPRSCLQYEKTNMSAMSKYPVLP